MAKGKGKPTVTVYQRAEASAVIGPLNAWKVGDEVTIPARGPKHGDEGLPEFTGTVRSVAQDGAAQVSA